MSEAELSGHSLEVSSLGTLYSKTPNACIGLSAGSNTVCQGCSDRGLSNASWVQEQPHGHIPDLGQVQNLNPLERHKPGKRCWLGPRSWPQSRACALMSHLKEHTPWHASQPAFTRWLVWVMRCDEKLRAPGTRVLSTPFPSCWTGADIWDSGKSQMEHDRAVFSAWDHLPLECWWRRKPSWFGWIGTGSRPLPTWEQMGIYEVRYFQTGRKRVTANLQKLLRVLLNDPPWKTLLPPQSSRHSSGAGMQGREPTAGPAAALADLTAPATENGQQQKANAPCPWLTLPRKAPHRPPRKPCRKVQTGASRSFCSRDATPGEGEHASPAPRVCDCSPDYMLTDKNSFSS